MLCLHIDKRTKGLYVTGGKRETGVPYGSPRLLEGTFFYIYSSWPGIRLRLRWGREAASWELEVIAHPARVLGNPDRSALYVP